MAYNKYNTRHSGRFNTPGQFVPAGECLCARVTGIVLTAVCRQLAGGAAPGGQRQQQQHNNPNLAVGQPFQSFTPVPQPPQPPQPSQPAPPRNLQQQSTPQQNPQQQNLQQQNLQQQNLQSVPTQLQNTDVDMKTEPGEEQSAEAGAGGGRPYWMRNKLAGVKKISNRERRRRQNENLRRLLTPKNALMVLNEMMPNDQLATQFKVEPTNQFYKPTSGPHNFCADLTVDGNCYKGYGENKLSARNAAAEKAIRDLIIKRMSKVFANDAASNSGGETAEGAEGESANGEAEEPLPMIQLASFALHKLFSEWEYEGVKVPQLKPGAPHAAAAPGMAEAAETLAPAPPKPKPAPKRRELPPNAATLHPCTLLTYMRPGVEYRELAVTGDKAPALLFTMGVDVDGATYIGKASNKKEARRAAARAACAALFNVTYADPAPAQ